MVALVKLTVVVLALAGVAVVSWLQVEVARATRPRVWTEAVRERDVQATVTGTGRARRRWQATLSSPDDGRVRAVLVRVGQTVRAGQALVALDEQPARRAAERARAGLAMAAADVRRAHADADRLNAELERARLAHHRAARLFAAGVASDETLARSRHAAKQSELARAAGIEAVAAAGARLRTADAERLEAELRLSRGTIRAPADGVITEIFVARDQPVHGGGRHVPPSPLLVLGAPGVTDIDVRLDSGGADRLQPGARASAGIVALGATDLEGRVVGVAGAGPYARLEAAIVRVRLDVAPPALRPGMSAIVRVTAASRPRALAVPNHAVATNGGRGGVWTIRNGVVALAPIVLGLRGDVYSEVLAGVSSGALVVTGPATLVRTLGTGDRAVAVPAPLRAP